MKIAIAAEKKDLDSLVCEVAGRAPYYMIFEDKKLIETLKNPFAIGGGGAGPSVAQMLYNKGVKLIISYRFGEKMINVLNKKGLKYKEIQNKTINQIAQEFS